jgi:DNA polymerase-3 subunit alpha (Gram-positive type)
LVLNQEGLSDLYRLVTLSHTQRLFRVPSIFRSDLTKYRTNLLLGAAGSKEGEMFNLFASFNSKEKIAEKIAFYDYVEVNNPQTFCYLWLNGKIREEELKEISKEMIKLAEFLKIPTIASHNVHYCEKEEKIFKEIIVASEGMNNSKHYLYHEAVGEKNKDRFLNLPSQHLLTSEEMINN